MGRIPTTAKRFAVRYLYFFFFGHYAMDSVEYIKDCLISRRSLTNVRVIISKIN